MMIYGTTLPEHHESQNSELNFAFGQVSFSSSTSVTTSSLTTETSDNSTNTQEIPGWIKNNAAWWADDEIDDDLFISGIQFLINQGIINISATSQTDSGTNEIPSWIKNNAGWWADDLITNDDFLKGITFLVEKGIIQA